MNDERREETSNSPFTLMVAINTDQPSVGVCLAVCLSVAICFHFQRKNQINRKAFISSWKLTVDFHHENRFFAKSRNEYFMLNEHRCYSLLIWWIRNDLSNMHVHNSANSAVCRSIILIMCRLLPASNFHEKKKSLAECNRRWNICWEKSSHWWKRAEF